MKGAVSRNQLLSVKKPLVDFHPAVISFLLVAALAFRFRSTSQVMDLEAFKKLLVALFKGVAGFSVVEITIPEEWDSAYDEFGLAMHVFER